MESCYWHTRWRLRSLRARILQGPIKRVWDWGLRIVREELHGNNWLKIVFDKSFRYFYTILVFNLMGYALEVWSPPLFFVGASMPIVDIIAFRMIDHFRKEKK